MSLRPWSNFELNQAAYNDDDDGWCIILIFFIWRPLNARERDIKSIGIVEVSGTKDVIVKQPLSDNKLTKKFSFDKAFGPNSKQVRYFFLICIIVWIDKSNL